jgi:hypothetical protein
MQVNEHVLLADNTSVWPFLNARPPLMHAFSHCVCSYCVISYCSKDSIAAMDLHQVGDAASAGAALMLQTRLRAGPRG